jgi:hypothetical protein
VLGIEDGKGMMRKCRLARSRQNSAQQERSQSGSHRFLLVNYRGRAFIIISYSELVR